MTKRDLVEFILSYQPQLHTRDVIAIALTKHNVEVSPRHVERVRKMMIAEKQKGNDMGSTGEDVFDARKPTDVEQWQMDLVNIVNLNSKGNNFWTIQELAEVLNKSCDEVRETLNTFSHLVAKSVLDEEKDSNIIQLPFDGLEKELDNVTENRSATGEDYWEVQIECVTACSKVAQEVKVFLSKQARQKAMLFMKWAKAREWLAYLVGEKKEDDYYVYDLYLPDQRTSSTLVDKVNAAEYNNLKIVGVIHSHHEMGAGDEDRPSFSGHDAEFINSNHNLSLLAGIDRKKGGFKIVGIARVNTPCGGMMKVKAVVRPMKEKMSDEEKSLQDEFKEKVFGQTNAGLAGKAEEVGNGVPINQRQFVDHRFMNGRMF